jgi:ribokinase
LDIIGFGALNMDEFFIVKQFSKGEKTIINSREIHPGGASANTMVGLSRLGLKTGLIGALGTDEDGKTLLNHLIAEKVDVQGIAFKKGKTGRAICVVDKKGRHNLFIDSGVNDLIGMDDINFEWLNKAETLHLTSFGCIESNKSFETQKKLVSKTTLAISFHPSYTYIKRGLEELLPIIKRSKIMFLSEDELAILTNEKTMEDGCRLLLDIGTQIMCVTRGSKGCYVSDGDLSFSLEAEKTEVVDTTGAGDAFCAGFLFGLLNNRNLKKCGRLGNKIASYCIQKVGCQTGLPTLKELKN